jgi:hypothetical protein
VHSLFLCDKLKSAPCSLPSRRSPVFSSRPFCLRSTPSTTYMSRSTKYWNGPESKRCTCRSLCIVKNPVKMVLTCGEAKCREECQLRRSLTISQCGVPRLSAVSSSRGTTNQPPLISTQGRQALGTNPPHIRSLAHYTLSRLVPSSRAVNSVSEDCLTDFDWAFGNA